MTDKVSVVVSFLPSDDTYTPKNKNKKRNKKLLQIKNSALHIYIAKIYIRKKKRRITATTTI